MDEDKEDIINGLVRYFEGNYDGLCITLDENGLYIKSEDGDAFSIIVNRENEKRE